MTLPRATPSVWCEKPGVLSASRDRRKEDLLCHWQMYMSSKVYNGMKSNEKTSPLSGQLRGDERTEEQRGTETDT